MDALEAIGTIWPIAVAFVTLVIVLAKMHSDLSRSRKKSAHCLSFGIIEASNG
jgi:hypothetical protein